MQHLSLPATALALILYHLDCSSAFKLAQTCQVCADEFAQQKEHFIRKHVEELIPTLRLDQAPEPLSSVLDDAYTYGGTLNPVCIHAWWPSNHAIQQICAMPNPWACVEEIWRRTWPKRIVEELVTNGYDDLTESLSIRVDESLPIAH